MAAGIDEHKMSRKRLIKVNSFPGATCTDMITTWYLFSEKRPDHVHVGINDVAHYEGTEIVDKQRKLK